MIRLLALVLSLQLLVANLAQGFDQHLDLGCADVATQVERPPVDDAGNAPGPHAGDCCFGSLVLGAPLAANTHSAPVVDIQSPSGITSPASWHSDNPDRPPRS